MSQKKQAYEEKVDAQLKELSAKIDVLKAKAEKSGADAKVKYYEKIEDLEKRRSVAREKLKELKAAGEDAWQDLKGGVEAAWSDLGAAVKSAMNQFK